MSTAGKKNAARYSLDGPVSFVLARTRILNRQTDITQDLCSFIERRLRHFFGDENVHFASEPAHSGGVTVGLSTVNPLVDPSLIAETVRIARHRRGPVQIQGAIPGTSPTYVTGGSEGQPFIYESEDQHVWNAQLNLAKLKRLKIFLSLCRAMPQLHTLETADILEFLSQPEGIRLVLSYGETVELQRYKACPACANEFVRPLRCGASQPRVGFLTRKSAVYSYCGSCGLVFLNPAPAEADLSRYYDWYDKEDVDAQVSVEQDTVYTDHYDYFLSRIRNLVPDNAVTHDLGGGFGHFAVRSKKANPKWQVSLLDFECTLTSVLQQQYGIQAQTGDFVRSELGESMFDLVTMWEVIEHLRYERLADLFGRVRTALKKNGYFAFSTPDFDSPLCRVADFWAAFLPQHLTVLSRRVLEPLWQAAGFRLVDFQHRALLTRKDYGEMQYLAENGGSLATRAEGALLHGLLDSRLNDDIQRTLLDEQKRGVEMIVTLQRNG